MEIMSQQSPAIDDRRSEDPRGDDGDAASGTRVTQDARANVLEDNGGSIAASGDVPPRISSPLSSIFCRSMLHETVRLDALELNDRFRNTILRKLRARLEGKCSRHGYIRSGSVELMRISAGVVRAFSLNGDAVFNVHLRADVCNPPVGSVLHGTVVRINRFGVLVSVTHDARNHDSVSVMDVIVAKKASFKSAVDVAALQVGDVVAVEILGKKFAINDDRICGVGKVLSRNIELSRSNDQALDALAIDDDDGGETGSRLSGGDEDKSSDVDGDDDAISVPIASDDDAEDEGADEDADDGDGENDEVDDDNAAEEEEDDREDVSDEASMDGSSFKVSSDEYSNDDYDAGRSDEDDLSDDASSAIA